MLVPSVPAPSSANSSCGSIKTWPAPGFQGVANLRPIRNRKPHKWLGMSPAMREWTGGRQPRGMRASGITIPNKKYESTLEVMMDEIRRDKTGQVMIRVQEQAERANAHWASLLSTLIIAGESTAML